VPPVIERWRCLVLNFQTWCRKHGVPYVHGCVWDRECRSFQAPLRVALMLGRTMLWVDLPGYYRDLCDDHRTWHGLSFGRYRRGRYDDEK